MAYLPRFSAGSAASSSFDVAAAAAISRTWCASVSFLGRPGPRFSNSALLLQLRRLTLLFCAAFQRGCALLLCFFRSDRTEEAQHGDLARKWNFSAGERASEINLIQCSAERNLEYSHIRG